MKVNEEFVVCYDAIFQHIFKTYGLDDLIKFWRAIAPVMLHDLHQLALKEGIKGCYKYWAETLKEEGAVFDLRLSDNDTKLHLDMKSCPSINFLNSPTCPEYCRHCGVMYPEVLKSAGLEYSWKKKGGNRCEILVEEVEEIE